MSATATLSSKYQISVPKAVREAQHWEVGQEFVFVPKNEGVLLVPVRKFEELTGMLKGANTEDYRDRNDRY
jgi:AbrB family looped-hinge helix DNA binding protein